MLKRYALIAALVFYGCGLSVTDASAQTVTKETLPGVTNFAKLDTTIACAGATTPQAVAGLKQMGYASNHQPARSQRGGRRYRRRDDRAKAAGITFIHLPFNGAMPDPAVADKFVTAVTDRRTSLHSSTVPAATARPRCG
jgi:hypothetical protein